MTIELEEVRHDRVMEWFEEEVTNPWHALVLVNYGKCVYWLGPDKAILEKGDALFIPQGTPYYAKSVPSVFHEKFVVRFRSAVPAAYAASAPGAGTPPLPWLTANRWAKLKPAMLEWAAERLRLAADEQREQAAFADVRAQAIVTELLALWHRQWSGGPVTAPVDYHAQRMKEYILEHYREKVTKETLGAHIGRSPNYAAALFRRATGQTISDFLHATRIKKAVYLLADSLLTVGEISEMLGYRDASYFHRLFKKTTGRTPADYMSDR